jgi:hypothetical protein
MSSMRRVLSLMLLLVLLGPVTAAHAASGADRVIKDCTDDEVLQGTYTQKELRNALAKLGADSAEYTNCAQVIHNAQLAAASGAKPGGGGAGGSGGSSGQSGAIPGGGTTTTPGATATTPKDSGNAPGAFGGFSGYPSDPTQDATASERAAIQQARTSPGTTQRTELAASTLPGPLIAALAAGGVALLVLLLLDLRRRVVARRG